MSQKKEASLVLLVIGIILVAANLRSPITAVGPLIPQITESLHLSNTAAGLITTIPLLAFAIFSPFAPRLAKRFGIERTIFYSLLVITIGFFIRSVPSTAMLFIGTICIGLAISIGNVLLPGFVKLKFPHRIGLMTGVYAVSMNVLGALGSGLSVPFSKVGSLGWNGGLLLLSVISIAAVIVWSAQLKHNVITPTPATGQQKNPLFRSPLAWSITLFMGIQSLIFYSLVAWLPTMLQMKGHTEEFAGWILFLLQMVIVPVSFVAPIVIGKMKHQVTFALFTAGMFATGIGLLFIGTESLLFVATIILGIACASGFSLAMMFFTLRTNTVQEAAQLSGMAQSFGYLLAASGPLLFGKLYDLTNDWNVSLLVLIGFAVILAVTGSVAGKKRTLQVNSSH